MDNIRFLGISGSLRQKSRNSGLLRAAKVLSPESVYFEIADIGAVPFYNADISEKDRPSSVTKVFEQLRGADALVLACPEYNYSLAPALKNILDWASREPDNVLLAGKPVAIMGAGGGMGTSRSQYHLRQTCVYLDLYPLNKPEVFSNAFGPSFDENGDLVDSHLRNLVQEQMARLEESVRRLQAANGGA